MGLNRFWNTKWAIGLVWICCISCHGNRTEPPKRREIIEQPGQLGAHVVENIRVAINYALDNHGKINDSIHLFHADLLQQWYQDSAFKPTWVHPPAWGLNADSLFRFIEVGKRYGLYPDDYQYKCLASIRDRLVNNSFDAKDAVLWALGDLMLTDAFVGMTHDVCYGRIPRDSTTLRKDSAFTKDQIFGFMRSVLDSGKDVSAFFQSLEPDLRGYRELKKALGNFLDSATFRQYTHVDFPVKDSVAFRNSLLKRFKEQGFIASDSIHPDKAAWAAIVKSVEKAKGLEVDGIPGARLVGALNLSDEDRFRTAALNLDRYKLLPAQMPQEYLWVNLPGFYLQMWKEDSLQFQSRVIVGAPATRTPELTSRLDNFVTYPVWTVPLSIIFHEMLPKIKQNVGYLLTQKLVVLDDRDSIVNPYMIHWNKFSPKDHDFPYRLRQLEGNDNSLGVIKFNFPNKYSVYLHDTNERDLFSKDQRDLSHGCVRVQDWKKLAAYLVHPDSVRYPMDTVKAWIARSEKHVVFFRDHVPLFLRYYTCDGVAGRLVFYDDIYGEDQYLLDRYFNRPL